MSHTAIEVTLQQLQLHQLFDDALDRLWRDAILLPDCVVALVKGLAILAKRLNFRQKRLFCNCEPLI
jgi:hypothetical protein